MKIGAVRAIVMEEKDDNSQASQRGCYSENRDDKYDPPKDSSLNWKHWKATWDMKTCEECKGEHGKIYAINDQQTPNLLCILTVDV